MNLQSLAEMPEIKEIVPSGSDEFSVNRKPKLSVFRLGTERLAMDAFEAIFRYLDASYIIDSLDSNTDRHRWRETLTEEQLRAYETNAIRAGSVCGVLTSIDFLSRVYLPAKTEDTQFFKLVDEVRRVGQSFLGDVYVTLPIDEKISLAYLLKQRLVAVLGHLEVQSMTLNGIGKETEH